jgi:protein SCO1/2
VQVCEELEAELDGALEIVSISLDPEVDTPEVLAGYAERHDVPASWTFYTGDLDEITVLRHRLGAFDPDPVVDADKTQHAAVLIFGNDPRGRWCAVPGLMEPGWIARLVRRAMTL